MLTPSAIDQLPRTTGFDFLVGEWRVDNHRLRRPLGGGDEWCRMSADPHAAEEA